MGHGVFIGLAGLDLVFYQDSLPLENHKSKTNQYMALTGGPAANAAITYAILGGEALLVTMLGNSPMADIIRAELAMYGVKVIDCAQEHEVMPSISAIAVNLKNASRTIWSGQQSTKAIKYPDMNQVLDGALFCLSDCNLMQFSSDFLAQARTRHIPVVLDAGSWKEGMLEHLNQATEVIASAHCLPPNFQGNFFMAVKDCGLSAIAVTNGEGPIEWRIEHGRQGEIVPPTVAAADTLGAGDIFHGAFCYFRFCAGTSFEEALKHAAEVAAESVCCFGTREGVLKFSRMQNGR